ncbi:MAG: hypothetical protein EA377_08265 [Phycisphaerales bacterium]|nr:MAG: hypothetical protein EA377_08265 [Phycisphaerales bacterium]
MLIYAGIDEAGYGPMLGPLCLGATVFVVPDHDPADGAPDLWQRLEESVCRAKRDRRQRIAVDDSKNLKLAKSSKTHPLKHLERGVLAFLGHFGGRLPEQDADMFSLLNVTCPETPWYATVSPLPLAHHADELRIVISRLARTLEDSGVEFAGMTCEAIDAGDFNAQVTRTNSKAGVNLTAALRLVDRIWRKWPDAHPRVILDRHGGRTHYREDLQFAWPDAHLTILAEQADISRYRLNRSGSQLTVTFQCEADRMHFPVALASMTAKYVRELFMLRLNRFFCAQCPELKPTAGYVQDARRYLSEIESVLIARQIDRQALIRVR